MQSEYERMWDDDERAPVCRIRHYTSTRSENQEPLSHICKAIIGDVNASKSRILWNEVEHVNYTYEPPIMCSVIDEEYDTAEKQETKNDGEVNHQCFDALVKNRTAYL